ncbi:MAG: insulinase family protein [Proteobacteria bacterium]|nr:insulinase family protein [Pseudomonadota bacterium]
MRPKTLTLLIILMALLPVRALGYDLESHVSEFRLSNGMRWLVVRRKQAPVFSGIVMVRAGGLDEEPGKTGLAHMFEHMAFKGTSRLCTKDWEKERPLLEEIERLGAELTAESRSARPDGGRIAEMKKRMKGLRKEAAKYQEKNEVWEMLMRNGANEINAYTNKDLTAFYASLPANRLALWAAVISDMVFDPAYRDFYVERSVVAQERRSGVDDDPNGAFVERLLATAFDGGGYSWPTVGSESDVMGFTTADAREFHRRHYVPANMVGVIVGDVGVGEARAIVQREFGKRSGKAKPPSPERRGKAMGGFRGVMKFNAAPAVAIAYHKPTLPDPAEYSFDAITSLLCDGGSSRLKRRLIFEERIAKSVYCSDSFPGSRLPNLFMIWVEPMNGGSTKEVMRIVDEEIQRLKEVPVEGAELDRVRKSVTASIMFSLDNNETFAEELARFQTLFDDWRLLGRYPEMIANVSPEEVMSVAREYLVESNRVILERKR